MFWSYINSRDKICDLMQVGELTSNNKEKAEVLNNFFSSVFTRENSEKVPEIPDRQFESSLDNVTIIPEEVLKKLYNLNPSKAAGPDGLHSKFLQVPLYFFAPNFGKVEGAYCFRLVSPCLQMNTYVANNWYF